MFKDKLKLFKVDLKVWNRDAFGCLDKNKKGILKEIEDLDNQDDVRGLDNSARMKKNGPIKSTKSD